MLLIEADEILTRPFRPSRSRIFNASGRDRSSLFAVINLILPAPYLVLLMPKYSHRTFEMFDFYDEAASTLKMRPRHAFRVKSEAAMQFEQLKIEQTDDFVQITFTRGDFGDDQPTVHLAAELTRLAALLHNDCRVLLNFEGVEQFSVASVDRLKVFYQRLKSKGSRLLLCNLNSEVKSSFYS